MKYLILIFVIILIHELGHLAAALVLRIKVQKFFIFFNPWFSLLKIKIRKVEVGLGWIPVGGYIQIEERNVPNRNLFMFYCSGVVANIIYGVLITGGNLPHLFLNYFRNNLHFENTGELIGFTSIIIAVVNLIPMQGTDGEKMYKIIKEKKWQ